MSESTARSVQALFDDAPKLRANNKPITEPPSHLQLTKQHREAMVKHMEIVGADRYTFLHNTADQGMIQSILDHILVNI